MTSQRLNIDFKVIQMKIYTKAVMVTLGYVSQEISFPLEFFLFELEEKIWHQQNPRDLGLIMFNFGHYETTFIFT